MALRGSGTAVPLSGTPAPACNIHLRITPHKAKRVFREMSYQNLLSQTISIGLAPLGKPELAATFLPSLRVKSWAGLVLISIDEAAKAAQQITSRTKVWLMNCSDAVVSIDREQALPGDTIQLRRGDKVHIHAWTFLVDWDFVYGDSREGQPGSIPAAVAHTSPLGQQNQHNQAPPLHSQQQQQQLQHQHQHQHQQLQHQQHQQHQQPQVQQVQQYQMQQPQGLPHQPLPQQLVQQQQLFQQNQHAQAQQQHLHMQRAPEHFGQQQLHPGFPGQQSNFGQPVAAQPSQELLAHMAQQRELIEEQSRRYEEQRKQLEELVAKQQQTIEKLHTVATGVVVPTPALDTRPVSADDLVMDDSAQQSPSKKAKGGRPKKGSKWYKGRKARVEDVSSADEDGGSESEEHHKVEAPSDHEDDLPPRKPRRASRSAKAKMRAKPASEPVVGSTKPKRKPKKRSSPREGFPSTPPSTTTTSSRSGRTISPPGTANEDFVDRQKQAYRAVRRLAKIAEGESVSKSFVQVPSRRVGSKRKRCDVEVESVEEQRRLLDETRSARARAYRESLKKGLPVKSKRKKVRKLEEEDTPASKSNEPNDVAAMPERKTVIEERADEKSQATSTDVDEAASCGVEDAHDESLSNPPTSPCLPPVSPITPMPSGENSLSHSHQDTLAGDIEMASSSLATSFSSTASTPSGLEQATAAAGLKPAVDIDMPDAATLEASSLNNNTGTVDLTSSPEQAGTSLPSPDLQEQAHREVVLPAASTPLAHSFARAPLAPVQPSQPAPARAPAAACAPATAAAASPWPTPQAAAFSEAHAADRMDELCGEMDLASDVSMSSTLGVYTETGA